MDTQVLWGLFFAAVVVETIVNIVRNIHTVVSNTNGRKVSAFYWISLAVGIGLGLLVGWNYDIDIFKFVGMEGQVAIIGPLLTGLIISRGSNIVTDVIERLNSWKK